MSPAKSRASIQGSISCSRLHLQSMASKVQILLHKDFTKACTCKIWGDGINSIGSLNPDCPCHRRTRPPAMAPPAALPTSRPPPRNSLTEEAARPQRRPFRRLSPAASLRHPQSATGAVPADAARRSSKLAGHGSLPPTTPKPKP